MMNAINHFLLICSGASLDLLNQPECRTELSRYRMMGAFVLLTSSFAALSGSFALYAGFGKLWLTVPIGLLWGLFIFTLDRFILSTIRKASPDANTSTSGKALSKLFEILSASPRLIMAVFIAVTVSVPLELRYFDPEIQAQMADNYRNSLDKIVQGVKTGFPEIEIKQAELNKMDADEETFRLRRDKLREEAFKEEEGATGEGFSGKTGYGPRARQRNDEYNKAEIDYARVVNENKPRRKVVREELDDLHRKMRGMTEGGIQTQQNGSGFLERFKALSQLADKDTSVKYATRFIVILLILIETAPVLIKLLARRGPYDDLIEAIEHKARIAKQKEISDFNSSVNQHLEHYDTNSEARWILEEQLRRGALSIDQIHEWAADDLKEAQAEIAKATVSAWKQKELKDIKGATFNGNGGGIFRSKTVGLRTKS